MSAAAVRLSESTFTFPEFDYRAMAPVLILFGAAVLSVLFEAFLPRRARRACQLALVFLSLLIAFAWVVTLAGTRVITGAGSV